VAGGLELLERDLPVLAQFAVTQGARLRIQDQVAERRPGVL